MNTYDQRRHEKSKRHCGIKDPYEHWLMPPQQSWQEMYDDAKADGNLREGFDEGQRAGPGDSASSLARSGRPTERRSYRVCQPGQWEKSEPA